MPSHVFKIEQGRFGLTLTDPALTDPCTATSAPFDEFTCQITSGQLVASPNVSDETVPATWCDPEQTLPLVGATSYELTMAYLQDPDVVTGLSRFLFEHDTKIAYWFMGLDGDDPPKAVGKCRLVAGALGGEGRTTLTAEVTLPVDGKPMVCFGTAAGSVPIGGTITATGATEVAGAAGTWTPAGAQPAANLAAMPAVTASPTAVWATGSHMLLGDATQATWDGTAWVAGVGAVADAQLAGAGAKSGK
jgi:hypothetical protein